MKGAAEIITGEARQVDLRRQIGVLRSWARWIILGTLLSALVALGIGLILPKEYEADSRLLVGQALVTSSPNVDQFATAESLAASYGGWPAPGACSNPSAPNLV